MQKIADYYDGSDILTKDNGSESYTRISPSSIANYFSSTAQWYRENLLGEKGFTGSTSTILGTVVHHFAELAANKQSPKGADKAVADYLERCEEQDIDFDRSVVESLWKDMSQLLIDSCVVGTRFHSTEDFIYHKVLPGIYVAGSYDALVDNGDGTYTVRDYKTAGTKPSGFSYAYRMQAHTYAYILTKMGYTISHVELQFVTKPTKTLPVRHFSFREEFTEENFHVIESQIKLIADSIDFWNKNTDERYLIAQDYRLKEQEKPDFAGLFDS